MPPQHHHLSSPVSGLIAHLYDAALDDSLWAGTATRIAESFGSTSAVLKLHDAGSRVSLVECTDNLLVAERDRAWADEWHRNDLWVERSLDHGLSRIITDEDLVTPEEQAQSGFYQEWLCRLDIHHLLGAVFPAADGAIGVLGIHRPQDAGGYTADDRRCAALVLPHLQRALCLGQRFAALSHAHRVGLQALDRLDTGVLMVDSACRILHASHMAERLLNDNPALGIVRERLSLDPPALHDRLLALVRDAMDMAQGRVAAPAVALAVPRQERTPLMLEIAPLRPATSPFGQQRPAVLIFIRDAEAPLAVTMLRQLFGLTRTEAAIAAELGRGASLDGIAADMGIGLATVRSHLKRIFAKTGTHRQAELAALLARSGSTGHPV